MNISFFVEFPFEELDKLSMIDFPHKIYLTADSLEEYREIEQIGKEKKPDTEVAYWPLLEKSYWVSPFSYNRELYRLHSYLSKNKQCWRFCLIWSYPSSGLDILFFMFLASWLMP